MSTLLNVHENHTHDDLFVLGNRLLILVVIHGRVEDLDTVVSNVAENPGLELGDLFIRHGVGLGNHGDEVDLLMESSHEFNVDGSQTLICIDVSATLQKSLYCPASSKSENSRMTSGLYKVEAGVDTVVNKLGPVHSVLLLKVSIETRLNVVDNGLPAIVVVDEIAKSRRVNDGETKTYTALLDV